MEEPRHFLKITDLTRNELEQVFNIAEHVKEQPRARRVLEEMSVTMLFEKPSTRTRVSFEVGISELGGQPVVLNASEIQLSRGEPVRDTARVLSRYGDGMVARVYEHRALEECVEFGTVPVVNALSDLTHPCQTVADLFTVRERRPDLSGLTFVYVGDGNNVCHSLLLAVSLVGGRIRVACPAGYEPAPTILGEAEDLAEETGGEVEVLQDPREAASRADVLYTDVWASMGQEEEAEKRRRDFDGFTLNRDLVNRAADDVLVMHCLPAHRGEEITDPVLEGKHSIVWDQAENRLHAQKGLLSFLYDVSG